MVADRRTTGREMQMKLILKGWQKSLPLQTVELISLNALASGFCFKNAANLTGASALRLMKRLNQYTASVRFCRTKQPIEPGARAQRLIERLNQQCVRRDPVVAFCGESQQSYAKPESDRDAVRH